MNALSIETPLPLQTPVLFEGKGAVIVGCCQPIGKPYHYDLRFVPSLQIETHVPASKIDEVYEVGNANPL